VALTGDGGDEVFAGYLRFRAALAAERLPRRLGAALRSLSAALPAGPNDRHLLSRVRRFGRFLHLPLLERVARWNSIFQDDLLDLLEPTLAGSAPALDVLANIRPDLSAIEAYSPLGQLLAANFASYLPDDLLVKTDRTTMANAIEARSPFLDTALVEYVASLPDEFKLQGRVTKAILREAFADLIPPFINRRAKTGFGVPLDRWFRGPLGDDLSDALLGSSAASRAYLRPAEVARLVDEHQSGRANHGHRLWTMLCFERWLALLPRWTRPVRHSTMLAPLS
jgi:asparagine synthase (glutamine-hydrolysing)